MTEDVNVLNSEIGDLIATIEPLATDVADLTESLKQLVATMAEPTDERAQNKAENEQTISAVQAKQTAIEEAMAVLTNFYEKAAEANAFTSNRLRMLQRRPTSPTPICCPWAGTWLISWRSSRRPSDRGGDCWQLCGRLRRLRRSVRARMHACDSCTIHHLSALIGNFVSDLAERSTPPDNIFF